MQEMGSINLKNFKHKEKGDKAKSHPFGAPANDGTCRQMACSRGEAILCTTQKSNLLDLEEGWSDEMGGQTNTTTYLCCYPPSAWPFAHDMQVVNEDYWTLPLRVQYISSSNVSRWLLTYSRLAKRGRENRLINCLSGGSVVIAGGTARSPWTLSPVQSSPTHLYPLRIDPKQGDFFDQTRPRTCCRGGKLWRWRQDLFGALCAPQMEIPSFIRDASDAVAGPARLQQQRLDVARQVSFFIPKGVLLHNSQCCLNHVYWQKYAQSTARGTAQVVKHYGGSRGL
ncbi:hypothetical protein V8C35DRAFT_187448 [Trichoderma chlorosporum]